MLGQFDHCEWQPLYLVVLQVVELLVVHTQIVSKLAHIQLTNNYFAIAFEDLLDTVWQWVDKAEVAVGNAVACGMELFDGSAQLACCASPPDNQ